MKKIKLLFASVAMGALLLTACGGGGDTQAPAADGSSEIEATNPWEATVSGDGSLDRVKEAGKIVVGLDDSYPPMGYRDVNTNELIGFDIDMSNAIGEKLGLDFEFQPADWNAIVPSLQTEKFDIIVSGMNMWDTRISEINFVPYGEASQYLIVRADSEFADMDDVSIEDFKDLKIGTQLGSTAAKDLAALGFEEGKNLSLYPTFPEITLDLDNGRIDALAIDSFGSVALLDSHDYVHIMDIEPSEGDAASNIGIGIRKADGDLQLALQKAVDELLVDGTLKELSMKWIGTDITEPLVADAQARLDAAK